MEVIIEAAKQVPALAVLGYIVVQFFRHLEKRDSQFLKHLESRDVDSRAIWTEISETQKQTTAVIVENSKVLGEAISMVERRKGEAA